MAFSYIVLKRFGIVNLVNTGFQDLTDQEIMEFGVFDVQNNEIGIFLTRLKHFGIVKWIIAGFYGFKNPEIIKMPSFDVWNNEIGILLYQSEAEKSMKLSNLF